MKDDTRVDLSDDFEDTDEVPLNRSGKCRQFLGTFVVNISTIMMGTVNGWMAPVQPLLMSHKSPIGRRLTDSEISWVGSVPYMGGIFGLLVWARAADLIGRKGAGYLIALPFIICWTMLLTCDSYWSILAARFIAGFGETGVLVNVPLYVGEIASSKLRGPLGMSLVLFLNLGYLLSFLFGSVLNYYQFNIFCLSLPIIYLVCFVCLPETPNYLLLNDREDEAKKSLLFFNGDNVASIDYEFKLLEASMSDGETTQCSISDLYNKKSTLKAFVIGLVLVVGQQITGIGILLTYTVAVFSETGTAISPSVCSIVVGLIMLISSSGSCVLINRLGRKTLLILSYLGMALSVFALSVCFLFDKADWFVHSKYSTYLPLLSYSLAVVFYSLGVGPVLYVLCSEILPSSVRNLATCIIITLGTFLTFATVKLFPTMLSLLGYFGTFCSYAICGVLLSLFCYLFVPETKNKSFVEIIEILENASNLPTKSQMIYVKFVGFVTPVVTPIIGQRRTLSLSSS